MTAALLLLTGCTGPAVMPAASPVSERCNLPAETRELAVAFVRLRTVRGHFDGGPWIADVDDWTGRKHQAMIELGSRLLKSRCQRAQVLELLGPPDIIAGPEDPAWEQMGDRPGFDKALSKSRELLIYYWRGPHDFLYFLSLGESIVGSGWWHAYE